MLRDDFDPQKRHYQLDLSSDGKTVTCTRCNKLLETLPNGASDTDMVLGQYRYIRQNLPCHGDNHD